MKGKQMNQEQIDRDTARLGRLIKSVRKYADDLCGRGMLPQEATSKKAG